MGENHQLDEQLISYFQEPELRLNPEVLKYLGIYPEEVIKYLTVEQVNEPIIYPEILELLQTQQIKKLVINQICREEAEKYRLLAKKYEVSGKVVDNPHYSQKTGIVFISRENVSEDANRSIISRHERLQAKGIPEQIINRPKAKLCSTCYDQLIRLAPEEKNNYIRVSWLAKFLGEECISCDELLEKFK